MKFSKLLRVGIYGGTTLSVALAGLSAAGQKQRPAAGAPSSALFESKIRPLFLTSCVSCHSSGNAQGGLRLDAAITPEKAQEALHRVRGEGGKPQMPLGGKLTPDKIGALEQWVREGAHWAAGASISAPSLMEKGKSHWAFQPILHPTPPRVKGAKWVRNPIDAFILKGLEAKGLTPSLPASRRELIRRVTYDLIGLPPTPEEVAAFETDKSPDAYEKLVDRLLASPHYGEKWGRHWLDLVRYAETNSYERDNPKPNIYKYRDYVIRSFNADKPYNQFVREQLAGDEIPNATGEAVAGTAYYRLGIWDDEPADPMQAKFDDLDDLVATTGQAFLGLTLDCARCHDHKLDPIPQKDYYKFAALFSNIVRFRNGGPTDEMTYFQNDQEKREYETQTAALNEKKQKAQSQILVMETVFRQKRAQTVNPNDLSDLRYRYYEGNWQQIPNFDTLKPVSEGKLSTPVLDLSAHKRLESFGFAFDGMLTVPQEGDYAFYLDADDGARLSIAGKMVVEKAPPGGQMKDHKGIVHLAAGKFPLRVDYVQQSSEFGLSLAWSGPGFARRPLSSYESASPMGQPVLLKEELPLVLGKEKAGEYEKLVKEREELAKQEIPAGKVLCVTETGPKADPMFLLQRGNPTTPGDKVEPGFPICAGGGDAVIAAPSAGSKTTGRRTALANWLTSPSNPLTARVIVNRIWQHHFGRAIVRTPNDFGLTGARPTQPELLDWLASEFVANGWSFKKLHKAILMSSTYQQSSANNTVAYTKDPQNDLFWRFDMRRLTAEEIRDSVLSVSGNINLAMFGEPIYPEIAKEILAGQSKPGNDWYTERMKPDDLNRRSIYIHVKRSLVYPLLASFDVPDTDRASAFRFASTQPTQALGLINGAFANKQATVLAERVRKEAGSDPRAFTRRVFSLVTQRTPKEQEISEGLALMSRLQKHGAKVETAQSYLCLMALNLDEFVYLD